MPYTKAGRRALPYPQHRKPVDGPAEPEIWQPIPTPGFDGWYEASSLGRIRRSPDHLPVKRGWAGKIRKPLARRSNKSPSLRPYVVLLLNYKRRGAEVGHWVARAFHGPPPPGYQCNHIDGNPWNNVPSNLEWVTHADNMRHAHRNGLLHLPRGEQQTQAKLTDAIVRAIRASREPQRVLAKKYGVTQSAIWQVRHGVKWTHVVV
jgi:HNH endonuclease/NUMOD4 motif